MIGINAASFDGDATPRRSTSSLGTMRRHAGPRPIGICASRSPGRSTLADGKRSLSCLTADMRAVAVTLLVKAGTQCPPHQSVSPANPRCDGQSSVCTFLALDRAIRLPGSRLPVDFIRIGQWRYYSVRRLFGRLEHAWSYFWVSGCGCRC